MSDTPKTTASVHNPNTSLAVLVVFLVVVCWLIFYQGKRLGLERMTGQRSFRDWPGQPLGTAERQASLSHGYNEVINPTLPDPYLYSMLDVSAQENSWNASDWSATQ